MKKSVFLLLCASAFLVFACEKTEDEDSIDANSVLLPATITTTYIDNEYNDESQSVCEYDSQNRLVKTYDAADKTSYSTYTYNAAGDLTSYKEYDEGDLEIEITCQKNGNTVTCTEKDGGYTYTYIIKLGSNNLPATMTSSWDGGYYEESTNETFTYDSNNNLKKVTELYESPYQTSTHEATYSYDDKKCPLYSCNTSKWFWFVLDFHNYEGAEANHLNNNFTKIEGIGSSSPEVTLSYTYEYNVAGYPTEINVAKNNGRRKKIIYTYKKVN